MKQHDSSDTRPGPSNIGFTVSSPKVLSGYGRVSGRGARPGCLPRIYRGYETISSALPGSRDTAKTSGMGYCCPTILRRSTPFRSAYANARGCSTDLDSVSRDRAANLAKPSLNCRTPLKNYYQWMKDPSIQLWCEDEVHFQRHSSLIRMWAPKGQQPRVLSPSCRDKVGFFGTLDLRTGILLSREASTFNAETFGDFVRYLLQSTQGKIYLILDKCEVAQSTSFERVILPEPGPDSPYLLTTIFPRT